MKLPEPAFAITAAVLVASAYLLGRFTAPEPRVEDTLEVVTSIQQVRTVLTQRVVDVKWKRVTVTAPDGTVKTEETGHAHEDTRTAENENNSKNEKTAETLIVEPIAKNWHLYVLGGTQVPTPWNGGTISPAVFGMSVSHRFIGPVWVQAVVQSNGTVTAGIGLEL